MLLRSSSTPVLGSLLSSDFSHQLSDIPAAATHRLYPPSIAVHASSDHDGSTFSGVRRSRSDGNLHNLIPDDDHHQPSSLCLQRRTISTLETIPSLSIYNSLQVQEDDLAHQEQEPTDGWDFSFSDEKEMGDPAAPPLFLARGLGIDRLGSYLFDADKMIGGGGDCGDGNGSSEVEMNYKWMLEDDPTNALCLTNYAQFLYQVQVPRRALWAQRVFRPSQRVAGGFVLELQFGQLADCFCSFAFCYFEAAWVWYLFDSKGDLRRAEEYYSRAILADPGDGETLSQYAKLTWELHHDEERASCYFQQAVNAAPHNSIVLGAYAAFLWEIDEEEVGIEDGGHLLNYTSGSSVPQWALLASQ